MTETEVFEMVSEGGATDFAQAMEVCREHGPFCLIGEREAQNPWNQSDVAGNFAGSFDSVPLRFTPLRMTRFSATDFDSRSIRGNPLRLQFTEEAR